ncbi:MAG: hypothetical protein JW838_09545 [Spirochaetes bacterium]|nr:hypothetical protein [Spirochaetota bacterium]
MGKRLLIACCLGALCMFALPSIAADEGDAVVGGPEKTAKSGEGGEAPQRDLSIDATALYGQYHEILWSGSLAQSFRNFSYALESGFNRSDDYGIRNTGFYDHELSFRGDARASKWRFTPEIEVGNGGRGMFRNPFFDREDRDRVGVKCGAEYRPMPMRWTFDAGGVYFRHRLDSSRFHDVRTLRPYRSSDLYGATLGIGTEYVWSAANRLAFTSNFSHYRYSRRAGDDTFVDNELTWNFNLAGFLKFGIGPLYSYNRDAGHFVSGKAAISTINIKYFFAEASYRYELEPFRPEKYYWDERFVLPNYRLKPGRGHRTEAAVGLDVSREGTGKAYFRSLRMKISGSFMTRDRYHSLFPLPEMVRYPHRMKLAEAGAAGEASLEFAIPHGRIETGGKYEYSYFYADGYVTYRPEHGGGAFLRIEIWRFETDFNLLYRGPVNACPFARVRMDRAFIGSLVLQCRIHDSLYLQGRIDNLFDARYSEVYGYPEPGRTFLGGIRVIL